MRRAVAVGRAVLLRKPARSDSEEFVAAVARSADLHGEWIHPPPDESRFRQWLVRGQRDDVEQFLVIRRDTDELAGFVNANNIIRGNLSSAFLGYGAFSPHAGQGFLSAGLELVLQTAFTSLGLHRLEANIQPGNHRSKAFVQRAGFRLEGYSPDYLRIQGVWRDHERWAITEPMWRHGNR